MATYTVGSKVICKPCTDNHSVPAAEDILQEGGDAGSVQETGGLKQQMESPVQPTRDNRDGSSAGHQETEASKYN